MKWFTQAQRKYNEARQPNNKQRRRYVKQAWFRNIKKEWRKPGKEGPGKAR
jgi:hypothetical protein